MCLLVVFVVFEPHVGTAVYEIPKIGPVAQIARTAVDLVDEEAVGLPGAQGIHHHREGAPPLLGCRFCLLEPLRDGEAGTRRVRLDRASLLDQRGAALALPDRAYPNVCKISAAHVGDSESTALQASSGVGGWGLSRANRR